jgi:hypothetical protein
MLSGRSLGLRYTENIVGLDEIPQPELSITNQSDEASSILPPSCQLVSPFPCFMGFRKNFFSHVTARGKNLSINFMRIHDTQMGLTSAFLLD